MGKLFAILGDIHANLDALEVVLADCRAQGVTDYLCTGDVVGYNTCPHECLEIIRGLNCPVVMGNHDHYVSSRQNLEDFNPHAAAVIEWTRKQLSVDEMYFLRSLPFVATKMALRSCMRRWTIRRTSAMSSTIFRPRRISRIR